MVLNTLVQKFDYNKYDVTVCSLVDVGKYNDAIKRTCNYKYVIPDSTGKSLLFRLWCSLLYHLVYFWLPLKWVYKLFIPKGFAHGFLVLSESAEFTYKCSDFYHPGDEGGLIWNDPDIGVEWPIPEGMELTFSDKDQKWGSFKEFHR